MQKGRQAGRQVGRQTDRQTDRQRDRQTDRGTDRQTDKQTDRQTDLFGELLLAQFVKREELLGKVNIPNKAASSQFHSDDDLTVRNHHGHCTKHDFQVFW